MEQQPQAGAPVELGFVVSKVRWEHSDSFTCGYNSRTWRYVNSFPPAELAEKVPLEDHWFSDGERLLTPGGEIAFEHKVN